MRSKSKCDIYRVHNYGRYNSEDPDFIIPSPTLEEFETRSKRAERITRIQRANEELRKLDKIYCTQPKEAYYEIHFNVVVDRPVEKIVERFIKSEDKLNPFIIKKVRGLIASSTLRRAFLNVVHASIRRGHSQDSTTSEKEKEHYFGRPHYVNRSSRR